jgi:hypothetical protein
LNSRSPQTLSATATVEITSQVELSLNCHQKYSPPTPLVETVSAVMEAFSGIELVMAEFGAVPWRAIVVIVKLDHLRNLYPSRLRRLVGLRG